MSFAVRALPRTYAVAALTRNADQTAEPLRVIRAVRHVDVRLQFGVRHMPAPVLLAECLKDTACVPVSAACRAQAVVIQYRLCGF